MEGPLQFDLDEINSLMPLPISSVRLAEMVSDPESTVREFARVIELDQALTANILRWANSAASHAEEPVTTVKRAVIRLGAANILKLTMGQYLMASLTPNSANKNDITENELWRHSVAAALAAQFLEKYSGRPMPGMVFTAALMHDIGKLIIGRRLSYDAMQEVIQSSMAEKKLTVIEAERELLKTDHAQVGALVARHWQLPEVLVAAIENHHQLQHTPDDLLDAVIVSDGVAKCIDLKPEDEPAAIDQAISLPHLQRFGLSFAQIPEWLRLVKTEIGSAESLWKMN